jgi:hypothetical protein
MTKPGKQTLHPSKRSLSQIPLFDGEAIIMMKPINKHQKIRAAASGASFPNGDESALDGTCGWCPEHLWRDQ